MSFAKEMQDTATQLLTEFDERTVKIKLVKNSESVWDSNLGEEVITEGATIDLTGVAVPYNQNMVNGTTIQTGDIQLTVTSATEPLAQDKLIVDEIQHSIINIKPFAFTGKQTVVAYQLQIRR